MTILFDAILATCGKIMQPHRGVSTDTGTTTTILDKESTTQDGYFNEGTMFLLTGTYASTFHKITKYLSTGTFTIATAVGGNIPSGIRYQAVPLRLDDLIASINESLREIGMALKEDNTLVVVPGQAQYTLPAGVSDVRMVEDMLSGIPIEKNRWGEIEGKIRFDTGFYPAGDTLRLTYKAKHQMVQLAPDAINSYVDLNWLATKAAIITASQLLLRRGDKRKYEPMITKLQEEELTFRNPTPDMPIVRLARW